jgi:uncharacterized protein
MGGVTPKRDRIAALDILRGFALLGILLVNMRDFSSSAYTPGFAPQNWSALDGWIELGIEFFAETKFYLLFSALFGIGFAVQMGRAAAKREPGESAGGFTGFYLRRLAILAAFGFAHAILLWRGDILRLYALLGVVLLVVRHVPMRALIVAAILLMLASFVVFGELGAYKLLEGASEQAAMIALYQDSSYGDLVWYRLTTPEETLWLVIQLPSVMAMFVIGLIIGRSGVLDDLPALYPHLRRWRWIALIIGVIGNGLYVFAASDPWLAAFGQAVGAPALAAFYACVVILAAPALQPLASVGKLGLTNYVMHSLIATTLFYGYGLGLYNSAPPTLQVALAVTIYALQIVLSGWWLRRYQFGILEWVWRSLTYGRLQPLRVQT